MEDLKLAFEKTIAAIVKHNDFSIETVLEPKTKLIAHIKNEDMPKVLGKGGKTAKAIRTILVAMNTTKSRIIIEFIGDR